MALRYILAAASVVVAAVAVGPSAGADRPEPVSLYGAYDTFLDHSKQTFNGQPRASEPSTQAARFTTTCDTTTFDTTGCVAHWRLVTARLLSPSGH